MDSEQEDLDVFTLLELKNKPRMDLECAGFQFLCNFDSGNLAKVELVEKIPSDADYDDEVDYEFNLWTRPDMAGTEFENGNRTWFFFGVKGGHPYALLKFNFLNLNKQNKIFAQGMQPVHKVVPGKHRWERIKDKPTFYVDRNQFVLSFKYRLQNSFKSTVYFAFTYPFTYTELQNYLGSLDSLNKFKHSLSPHEGISNHRGDDIYYQRELISRSLDGRRIDLITITSHHGISSEHEPRYGGLFPDKDTPRAHIFHNKRVVVLSARVHPGETPSSFVMIGVLNLLVSRSDPTAISLRKHFVFKILPMLNPDGVFRGHYRTDSRGINLNRMYMSPSSLQHPSIYSAKQMIMYHHNRAKQEKKDDSTHQDEGLYMYVDMHGHASKKGVFVYGNHFESISDRVECMLYPKLISLNSQHFHFESCNFTEKNMYARDKRDGLSREGSGRVAVLKSTGLVHSYTLECNYNMGKLLNPIAPPLKSGFERRPLPHLLVPPKYTPAIFEEVGRSLLHSLLDLSGHHPNSRLHNTQHRTIGQLREWLRCRALQMDFAPGEVCQPPKSRPSVQRKRRRKK